MKKFLFIATGLLISISIFSQGNKSLFLEIAGNGIGFSLNYDARFKKTENGFGYRVGLGIVPGLSETPLYPSTPSVLTIPVGINYLLGRAPHHLEAGIGITYFHFSGTTSWDFWGFGSESVEGSGVFFFPSVGYRYARRNRGFQGRIFISPGISSDGVSFFGGLSLGYKF